MDTDTGNGGLPAIRRRQARSDGSDTTARRAAARLRGRRKPE
jgi:hypothetical protein